MKLEYELLINQFGQELISENEILRVFSHQNTGDKKIFLEGLLQLIQQSKPLDSDINEIIHASKLRATYTPCILLRKGIAFHNLQKIIHLPENESIKSLILLLHTFRIAYQRRFKIEYNNPNKWWYWNLSDENIVKKIKLMHK